MNRDFESVVLACDIDDTLVPIRDRPLEERAAGLVALQALSASIETLRPIYNLYFGSDTGRSFASHQEYEAQEPTFDQVAKTMDFQITSVGTESRIRTPEGLVQITDWPKTTNWQPRAVHGALSGFADLILQPDIAQGDYKVSFNVEDKASQDHAGMVARISEQLIASGLAANVVLSGVYLDILPLGVHKGTGLLHTIARMAVGESFIVASGDSMNDTDLLQVANLAILPSNAHLNLVNWAQRNIDPRKLYQASRPFAAGVHEGLNWALTSARELASGILANHNNSLS